jgi:hypothetical protein
MIEALLERARAMARHDGAPAPAAAHIHGAANQLQAELLRARDQLLQAPPPADAPLTPGPDAKPAPAKSAAAKP